MFNQKANCGKINEFLSGFSSLFVISSKPSESIEPCECPFNHPSEWFWDKALDAIRSVGHFYIDGKLFLDVSGDISSITSVDKKFFQSFPSKTSLPTQFLYNFSIVYACMCDNPRQRESVAVYRYMPFDSFHFLVAIISIDTLPITPFDTLRVQCSDRGTFMLPSLTADFTYKFLQEVFNMSFLSPFTEEVVDILPGRHVMGQHSPLTSCNKNVEDGFKYGAERIFACSAIIFKEYFVYIRPLTLGQVCLIEIYSMHVNNVFSFNTLIEGLLLVFTLLNFNF